MNLKFPSHDYRKGEIPKHRYDVRPMVWRGGESSVKKRFFGSKRYMYMNTYVKRYSFEFIPHFVCLLMCAGFNKSECLKTGGFELKLVDTVVLLDVLCEDIRGGRLCSRRDVGVAPHNCEFRSVEFE